MNNLKKLLQTKRLILDGGTGSVLQQMGLPAGTPPEAWNLTNQEQITALHRAYLDAGSDIVLTNTFGVNALKYRNYEQLITAAFDAAKAAVKNYSDRFIAFDIGPTGRLLKPLGDLDFEAAVEAFAAGIKVACKCGADLIFIETMGDSYETKAAVLAAKENCDLPIFVSNAYDESGKLMTGADAHAMIALLEGLGVDAIGMNCSFGPDKMLPLIEQFATHSSTPIIVKPNAGLPKIVGGETVYDIDADLFAEYGAKLAEKGATILGGCCGTTPEHIRKLKETVSDFPFFLPTAKHETVVCSYTHAVQIGNQPILIGERLNPTGKPKLKEAICTGNTDYILNEALKQTEYGVHLLDVNVGLPEIDEKTVMAKTVTALQAVTDTPLQIDSTDAAVLEKSMRLYNGKPLINSVNGKTESMRQIFPLIKKYGGAVIALAIDENGIPNTAEKRVEIIEKIIATAEQYGIGKENIIADPLAMAVSSDKFGALTTLKSVALLNKQNIRTSLGVSNISFGLPQRVLINATFFAEALEKGLDCAIMNPFSTDMMNVYYTHRVLHAEDENCSEYIAYVSADKTENKTTVNPSEQTLKQAIIGGLKSAAATAAEKLLQTTEPLEIINGEIIPALNKVGTDFETGKSFLPQLLISAEAATAAFEVVKQKISKKQTNQNRSVILATVKGDIHDIGKNIVKVLLESYGFYVYDLGRDVAPQDIVDCAVKNNCKLVGLSALMTTTVPAMAETVTLLKNTDKAIQVVVGGAVLNQDYANMISADCYSPTAIDTVRFAEKFYQN